MRFDHPETGFGSRALDPRPGARAGVVALAALVVACGSERSRTIDPGVPLELAVQRARLVSAVEYDLFLRVPASREAPVHGDMTVHFNLGGVEGPVALDFAGPPAGLDSLVVNGRVIRPHVTNEHILLPADHLVEGGNKAKISFTASDLSLNRNETYLYTLFVPDRARFAFPCFDQPDLKARFRLTLDLPTRWSAVSNGGVRSQETVGDRTVHRFHETKPISTYLFAFTAGAFQTERARRAGRILTMLHRETDSLKVARNREAIFDLHETALTWLEDYTGIAYPFEDFRFVLIPSFQYGGMEHPGATFYRDEALLLDESATQNDRLRRASLIAHETAHMWFGNLVTMEWFNDVWMKEVFANFMAAKIVHPSFPEIDHDLRFLLTHYPAAYEVDRSAGANPIRQELDNLQEAGTLYGAIIYQKAPIVMRQLERLVGEETMRAGLREYLDRHSWGNATWLDLIEVLDRRSEEDLRSWSQVWVEESGRPRIHTQARIGDDGRLETLTLVQSDPAGRGRVWIQQLDVLIGRETERHYLPVQLDRPSLTVDAASGLAAPDFVIPNGRGFGYGLFSLDPDARADLLDRLPELGDATLRAVAWLDLWDAMLEGLLPAPELVDLMLRALPDESEELNVERVLDYLDQAYWRYLGEAARRELASRMEEVLWTEMQAAARTGLKAAYFNTYLEVAMTDEAVERLRRVWSGDLSLEGLPLSERDLTGLALALAVREPLDAEMILDEQARRIDNPDRRDRFEFVRSAVSADPAVREAFFASLQEPRNREDEPWVLDALGYLHHPLRAEHAVKYLRPSLELLEEIQRTGDIFFPKRWLDASFSGHNSVRAAEIVCDFLRERPTYPDRLRRKILQSADPLFRAAVVVHGWSRDGCS